jgi:tetratricopeptide (TPR) repeat protein
MLFSTTCGWVCCEIIFAASLSAAEANSFAARAERSFIDAQQIARKEPTNVAALLQLARAAFDWAEFPHKDEPRAGIANTGIEAARRAIAKSPTNAAAYYWLAMDFGQLARTKSLGALRLVREMEAELLRARALDPHVDFAGPDRSLGLLYRDAPGWPTSIGSKKKAREHLERAVELHPEFPDNQLALLESCEKWGDKNNFHGRLAVTERFLTAARQRFTGPQWDQSWADWNSRLADMKSKTVAAAKPVTTKGAK